MSRELWDTYAVCPGCDRKYRAPFASLFHIHFEVCPNCGEPKDDWPIKTMRYVNTVQIFRPSTWGTGHWETRS